MNIRKFVAPTMRDALQQVRVALGADAVILSNRRTGDSVELLAADDYDEAVYAAAMRHAQATAPAVAASPPAPVAAAPAPTPTQAPTAAPAPVASVPAVPAPPAAPVIVHRQDPEVLALRRELQGLRQLLETQVATLARQSLGQRDPLRARVVEDLEGLGMTPEMAAALAEETPAAARVDDPEFWRVPLALLARRLPVVDDGLLAKGGMFALVGPTGVGKTTTIAKLAARFVVQHGASQVALVTTDHYRIGAREQLLTYARMLGVPMHAASTAAELSMVLDSLAGRKLVLVDTAGMGPRDLRFHEQSRLLDGGRGRLKVLLTLAANTEYGALDAVAAACSTLDPAAVVLTKVDEAHRLGGALSVLLRHDLPLAHLCDGQRVPEDLHAAGTRRIWLVREALKRARAAAKAAARSAAGAARGVARHA
jgi:flagellar biosynthesis protein FlhF